MPSDAADRALREEENEVSIPPSPLAEGGKTREAMERESARRRAEARRREEVSGQGGGRDPYRGIADPDVARQAFATLADNVRDYAIFLMDPQGVITFWGEGARLLKWWTKDEAEGAHLSLLYPDGGSEDGTADEHLRMAAETGEYTGEGHRVRSDCSTFWAGITLTPLRDARGELIGFAKVTRDLTSRRATEAARIAALETAEEGSRLKSLFLATMSHEIRTPLNAIMAYTDFLGMELAGPLTAGHHDQLGKIRASSQHLLGIIEEVLDLSRIESGRMVPARASLHVGHVISEAMLLVEPQAQSRGVDLVDAVSGFATDTRCWGDGERVRQILVNLLGNAVKFTDPGGRVTVSAGTTAEPPAAARLQGEGPWIYLRIEDTGRGIPEERTEAIFEPFVQADMTLTRQHGGTGLGLAISRKLARLMGGELTVRSEVGVGSSFLLWLPAAPEHGPAPTPPMETPPRDATLQKVRAAIIGDLERILHAYVARLRSDSAIPNANTLSDEDLEDHLASFLSDLAQSLGAVELAAGADSTTLKDSSVIQRTISDRHGRQRGRLGWGEEEIQREFQILREELAAAVRRRVRLPREGEVEEAIDALDEAVSRAEQVSIESHRLQIEGGDAAV